jgi:SAM-dependent methyltransferase
MSARTKVARAHDGTIPQFFLPLAEPRWVAAGDARHMRPDDPVLGIEHGAQAWALPWWVMARHHLANLTLGGRPMLVTLCILCSSAAAYDPVVRGRRFTFRVDGVHNGTYMAIDYDTGSHWSPTTGEAIDGPCQGITLQRLPLLQCTWREWVEMHPASVVLDGGGESQRRPGQAPGSPLLSTWMQATLGHVDKRLPHYELVLGVSAGAVSRCYPLAALEAHGAALNDRLGGEDIAVFSRPGSWMAAAFRRSLDGRALAFSSHGPEIVDDMTGSCWTLSGRAHSGPLAGQQLEYVHSGVEEFFIWAAFHPGAGIFGHEATGAAGGAWSGERVPAPLLACLNARDWWARGARLLHAGCGDGMLSALMAERALQVTAIDGDAARLQRARARFRGLAQLEFKQIDLRAPARCSPRFDALFDHDCFWRLAPAQRAAYAANVAAAARAHARFLLLVPAPAPQAVVQLCRRVFGADFRFAGARVYSLPHPDTGHPVPGVALRLERYA